jgi:hypothetical protein
MADARVVSPANNGITRWTPIASLVAALLMATLALPSILRQTPPEQNQSAEFSPDAPPDQPPLIAALNRANSATAGSGNGTGGDITEVGEEADVPPGPDRYCPYGVGKPRRQTFSVYSTGCAPAFHGNNGGRTAPGVSATEIRVALYFGTEGDYDDPNTHSDPGVRDLEKWVNTRYQLYGRRLHVYGVNHGANDSASAQAAAARARNQYDVFAAFDPWVANAAVPEASVQQKIITWTLYRPNAWFRQSDPYGWSFSASTDRQIDLGMETVCKQLAGKPPEYNERKDLTFDYAKPRKFGAVVIEQGGGTTNEDLLRAAAKRCGITLEVVVPYSYSQGAQNVGTVMSQMKARGVTTILDLGDQFTTQQMTTLATNQQYWPEWFVFGNNLAINSFMQGADQDQWRHAFGVTVTETPRPIQDREWYQALQQVDPDNANQSQDDGTNAYVWYGLVSLANGIQAAGPNLTPETFAAALHKLEPRTPNPQWSIGGSFRSPDPWAFSKYAALIWWDPDAIDPILGDKGAYRYLYDSKRFTSGQIPTQKIPFFTDPGVLQTSDS